MEPHEQPGHEPKVLTTVSDELEGTLICGRLSEAGISHRLSGAGARFAGGTRSIWVEQRDLDRARDVLKASEGFSEEDLAQLSEEELQRINADPPSPDAQQETRPPL
jgi:hypothetical protein